MIKLKFNLILLSKKQTAVTTSFLITKLYRIEEFMRSPFRWAEALPYMRLNVFGSVTPALPFDMDPFEQADQTHLTIFGGCVESMWGQTATRTKPVPIRDDGTKWGSMLWGGKRKHSLVVCLGPPVVHPSSVQPPGCASLHPSGSHPHPSPARNELYP